MIPAAKLDRLLDRFAAIEAEMASGVGGDAFVKLSREHAELAPVIETARAWRGAQSDLLSRATAEEMTRRGPKPRLVEIAGVGHAPTFLQPEQIAIAREFLTG